MIKSIIKELIYVQNTVWCRDMADVNISLLYTISMNKILIVNFIKVILHRKYVLNSSTDKNLQWIPIMVALRMWGQ